MSSEHQAPVWPGTPQGQDRAASSIRDAGAGQPGVRHTGMPSGNANRTTARGSWFRELVENLSLGTKHSARLPTNASPAWEPLLVQGSTFSQGVKGNCRRVHGVTQLQPNPRGTSSCAWLRALAPFQPLAEAAGDAAGSTPRLHTDTVPANSSGSGGKPACQAGCCRLLTPPVLRGYGCWRSLYLKKHPGTGLASQHSWEPQQGAVVPSPPPASLSVHKRGL